MPLIYIFVEILSVCKESCHIKFLIFVCNLLYLKSFDCLYMAIGKTLWLEGLWSIDFSLMRQTLLSWLIAWNPSCRAGKQMAFLVLKLALLMGLVLRCFSRIESPPYVIQLHVTLLTSYCFLLQCPFCSEQAFILFSISRTFMKCFDLIKWDWFSFPSFFFVWDFSQVNNLMNLYNELHPRKICH